MKSSVTKKDKTCIKNYPYIARSPNDGVIILFNKLNTGIVLYDPNSDGNIGYYSDLWDEYKFENFDGSIILTN